LYLWEKKVAILKVTNLHVLHRLFEKCHGVVPYQSYYEACKYDACALQNKSVACISLEAYAQECGLQSVCVDWRNSADLKGLCGKTAKLTHHCSTL